MQSDRKESVAVNPPGPNDKPKPPPHEMIYFVVIAAFIFFVVRMIK